MDVSLVYLDPPYWKQAEGQYSKDATDLANMPLDGFNAALAGIIKGICGQTESIGTNKAGLHCAYHPTYAMESGQPSVHRSCRGYAENGQIACQHALLCTYESQQCTPQMVTWAKDNKRCLVLTRDCCLGDCVMPQEEIFGTRDRSYSAWHRRNSTRRFVGIEKAQTLAMIDLDASLYVEYDDKTKDPLILIETAMDRARDKTGNRYHKSWLSDAYPFVGLCALYTLSNALNPADPTCKDIVCFRAKRLHQNRKRNGERSHPQEWADHLVALRNWASAQIDQHHKQSMSELAW